MRRMAETVHTRQLEGEDVQAELARHGLPALPPGLMVYEISGPMFFGAVEHLERALLQTHTDPRALVIRLRNVPFMDITGIQTLGAVTGKLRKRGVRVVLCEANSRVQTKLRNAQVLRDAAQDQYFESFADAVRGAAAVEAPSMPTETGAAQAGSAGAHP